MYLFRLVAPHFVAGLEIADCKVYRAAPILAYMNGWALAKVIAYARSKGWSFSLVLDKAGNRHLLETSTTSALAKPSTLASSPAPP